MSKKIKSTIDKAVKKIDAASDALWDLIHLIPPNVDTKIEEKFAQELRERARYWENSTWWKNDGR